MEFGGEALESLADRDEGRREASLLTGLGADMLVRVKLSGQQAIVLSQQRLAQMGRG